MKLALEFFETSVAAATTINARLPILYRAAMTGTPTAVRESHRMITEKAQAAVEGATAAGTAALDLWLRAAASMSTPSPAAWLNIMQAGLAPARRTCHANARRLGLPRRRRR
jgi:hypothetical protein